MSEPKIITVRVDDVSMWEFEGTLSTVLERIQELIARHGAEARLDYNQHFYYDYDSQPSPRFDLYIEREETPEEVKKRVEKTREDNAQREAREKAEFERLAKKYGEK